MKTIFAAIIGFLFVQSTSAFVSPQQFNQVALKQASKSKTKKQPQQSCMQIAGKWKGTCTGPEGKIEGELKVEQSGCTSVTFISQDSQSGQIYNTRVDLTGLGLSQQSAVEAFIGVSSAYAGKWNDEGTVMSLEMNAIVNSVFLKTPRNIMASEQVMKDGKDLVAFLKTFGTENDGEISCRYHSVQ